MRDRLEILWKLLSNDGFLSIQIDDNEFCRLYLLCAELFGEKNLKVVCVKMSEPSGLKMGTVKRLGTIPKLKEYIVICGKSGVRGLNDIRIPKDSWDSEYNIFLDNFNKEDRDLVYEISDKDEISEDDINRLDALAQKISLVSVSDMARQLSISNNEKNQWLFDNSWRICQCATSASVLALAKEKRKHNNNDVFFVKSVRGLLYMVRGTFSESSAKPRVQLIFADDNLTVHPGDLWVDFKTTGLDGEGGVDFKNGKKPEALINRVLEMTTSKGDLVLDSFGGSGTTGAVAHKMGRRWIMVELGEHCHTHIIPRLQKVIDGTDQGGISQAVNWQGGGGFRYYKLAPSLIVNDRWGNAVINPEYNAAQLSEALCKLEGFTYSPSETHWWQQGYSSERDFILVTTQNLSSDQLQAIADDVGADNSLLVCCAAFHGISADQAASRWPNLTLKKIPKMVLSRCEWGHDDYSLNVANLPMAAPDAPTEPKVMTKKTKKADTATADLFGGDNETEALA